MSDVHPIRVCFPGVVSVSGYIYFLALYHNLMNKQFLCQGHNEVI